MSAKTKIVVLRMKELICAGIFAAVGLILIILLLLLFLPDRNNPDSTPEAPDAESTISPSPGIPTQSPETSPVPSPAASQTPPSRSASAQSGILQESQPTSSYIPGIYKTELVLGGQTIEVEAILKEDRISSLRLVNLDEAITTMYPLLQPTMDSICQQVYESQSLNYITYDPGAKYTSLVLLEAIRSCLEKAADPAAE